MPVGRLAMPLSPSGSPTIKIQQTESTATQQRKKAPNADKMARMLTIQHVDDIYRLRKSKAIVGFV